MHNLLAEVPHMGGEEETLNLVSTFNKETTKLFCVYVLKSMIKLRIKVTAIQGKAVFFLHFKFKAIYSVAHLHLYSHTYCLFKSGQRLNTVWMKINLP